MSAVMSGSFAEVAAAKGWSPLRQASVEFNQPRRPRQRWILGAILAGHVLAAWWLVHLRSPRQAPVEVAPLMVSILGLPVGATAAAPAPPAAAREPARTEAAPRPTPPQVDADAPAQPRVTAEPVTVAATDSVSSTTATAAVQTPAPATTSASTEPASPPGPRNLPPSAVRYLVPPQLDYPRASRRKREAGHALVRVYIDEAGLPQSVQISQSTGFALLDEAALAAVRKARFKPYMESGHPVAGWALIPLTFDLET